MAIAVNPNEPFDYVLREDRALPAEQQTVFHLRPLAHTERVKLSDMQLAIDARTNMGTHPQGTIADLTLKCGLQGWSNFRDKDGNEVTFDKGKMQNLLGTQLCPPTDGCLGRLHPDHARELVEAIADVQRVTDEEGKD